MASGTGSTGLSPTAVRFPKGVLSNSLYFIQCQALHCGTSLTIDVGVMQHDPQQFELWLSKLLRLLSSDAVELRGMEGLACLL